MRVHRARCCDLYLRVRSRPIIEDCDNLGFAPLTDRDLDALGISDAAAAAGLAAAPAGGGASSGGGGELWCAVDDFGWVKATQSPHWRVLPEAERAAAPAPPAADGACGARPDAGAGAEEQST